MKKLIKETIKPFYYYLRNKQKRELFRLWDKLGTSGRYTKQKVTFLKKNVEILDWLSFVEQFREIFVEEIYKFQAADQKPVILDCGANIGVSVLYFKELFPQAVIMAFEPDPAVFKVLEQNIINNNLTQVNLINKAVWINDEALSFSSEGTDGGSVYGNNNKIEVQAIRLKDILEKEPRIDLLKIDIEGAETDVLMDCRKSLDKVENIFVEYHSLKKSPQNLQLILDILTENNFRYHFHTLAERKTPFIDHGNTLVMDVQMNIFAHR
jgi:FkbM family methyltransferase